MGRPDAAERVRQGAAVAVVRTFVPIYGGLAALLFAPPLLRLLGLPVRWSHVDASRVRPVHDGVEMLVAALRIRRQLRDEGVRSLAVAPGLRGSSTIRVTPATPSAFPSMRMVDRSRATVPTQDHWERPLGTLSVMPSPQR